MDSNNACPLCNTLTFTVLYNKGLERSLLQLKVRCGHYKAGCSWEGDLKHYDEHLNLNPEPDNQLSGCKYVELDCTYLCGGRFHRGAMAKHRAEKCPQRPFCCDYCQDYTSVHANVVYRHWQVCKCYPMECPNHCSVYAIERQNMEEHLESVCPLKLIECEFHSAGCEDMVPREDMDDHLSECHVQHTSMLAAANARLQDELVEKGEHIQQLKEETRREVKKVRDDYQERMDNLWLENAFLKQELSKIRTEMSEMKKELLESLLQQKNNQLEKEESSLKSQDSLALEVAGLKSDFDESKVSLYEKCYSIQAYVGVYPVEFIMPQFSLHLKDGSEWESSPFYSHLEGYRLCLVVNPKGKGSENGSHVSVSVYIMRGDYDCRLKWPFQGKITVQLRNQVGDRHHATGFVRFTEVTPVQCSSRVEGEGERAEEGRGVEKFISHSDLSYCSVRNRQYLKEDKLYFRIIRVQL